MKTYQFILFYAGIAIGSLLLSFGAYIVLAYIVVKVVKAVW